MSTSDAQLRHWFNRYNAKYFAGALPIDTQVYWEPMSNSDDAAVTCPVYEVALNKFKITVDPAFMGMKFVWKQLLLHEMAHVHLWRSNPKHQHGRVFKTELDRLYGLGAYYPLL